MEPKTSADPDDQIVDYLLANPKQIDLYYWNQNPNPRTIDYILEKPRDRLYRFLASKNPHDKMVDYLLENPIEISRFNFLENPNPKAVDYFFEKGWHLNVGSILHLSRNPNQRVREYLQNVVDLPPHFISVNIILHSI
jgi:hypothetical protein